MRSRELLHAASHDEHPRRVPQEPGDGPRGSRGNALDIPAEPVRVGRGQRVADGGSPTRRPRPPRNRSTERGATMTAAGYKLVILLKARAGLAADAFADAWVQLEREDQVSSPGMLRYAFDAPLAGPSPIENAPTAPFDAAVETWWDNKNSAADWVVSRAFVEQWLPRRLELLASRPTAIGGIPQVIWEREEPSPGQRRQGPCPAGGGATTAVSGVRRPLDRGARSPRTRRSPHQGAAAAPRGHAGPQRRPPHDSRPVSMTESGRSPSHRWTHSPRSSAATTTTPRWRRMSCGSRTRRLRRRCSPGRFRLD